MQSVTRARIMRSLLALCAASMAIFWQSVVSPHGQGLIDERIRDLILRQAASPVPETRLTVVDIDEASLAAVGAWPWSREQLATLIETLFGHYGARSVGIDMVLPEPADATGDALIAALAREAPLTLAVAFDYAPRHPPLAQGFPGRGRCPARPGSVVATGYIGNHAGLAEADTGNIGFVPDDDGTLRRVPWTTELDGCHFASLAAAMLQHNDGQSQAMAVPPPGLAGGYWRLAYRKVLDAYTVVPAGAVMSDAVARELVAGRHVLIGSSALGLADRVSTPLHPSTAGVFVHAAMLTELLDRQQGLSSNPWPAQTIAIFWAVLSVGLVILALPRFSPSTILALIGIFTLLWSGFAYFAILSGSAFAITAPLFSYLFLIIFALPHEWWLSRREARRMQRLLGHYVSPAVLEELLKQPGELPLRPRYCEVSVLTADMEGYTPLTSSLSLEDAAQLTRDFLDALTRPILTAGGTLDKYTGDGLVAFWGAPLPCPDQADRAIRTAQEIVAQVAQLNRENTRAGLPAVRVRIGIESGPALVGDLGTPFRSTYTAVGDCINHAARLQGAAKNYPDDIIIGPTASRLARAVSLKSLGNLPLRGTEQVIPICTVNAGEVSPAAE